MVTVSHFIISASPLSMRTAMRTGARAKTSCIKICMWTLKKTLLSVLGATISGAILMVPTNLRSS
jgi:hypothetical protein